ncbi:hypothetical protein ITR00_06255 [Pediococcus pentosaceus]|uniref:hypothetical protein n=1 Tax=Pediococcus pentosaceus TaxID=1255 RepID=UPI00190ACE9E|nr:hypothetical protein [Pediococcus pentosaceus]MBF7125662.1 hypothetical protein [Pediococcus pentosaceus]WPK17286.1 hypothetical protein R6U75_03860 [Pediococcus pentosaceus]
MVGPESYENYFICDSCGEVIDSPKNGWLEWKDVDLYKYKDFRIVHHSEKCMYKSSGDVSDGPLAEYTNDTGVMRLYEFLKNVDNDEALNNLLEIIKRITIKDYESVRKDEHSAAVHGYIDDLVPGFPSQGDIKAIKRYQEDEAKNI